MSWLLTVFRISYVWVFGVMDIEHSRLSNYLALPIECIKHTWLGFNYLHKRIKSFAVIQWFYNIIWQLIVAILFVLNGTSGNSNMLGVYYCILV